MVGRWREVQFLVILTDNVPPSSEIVLVLLSNAYSLGGFKCPLDS